MCHAPCQMLWLELATKSALSPEGPGVDRKMQVQQVRDSSLAIVAVEPSKGPTRSRCSPNASRRIVKRLYKSVCLCFCVNETGRHVLSQRCGNIRLMCLWNLKLGRDRTESKVRKSAAPACMGLNAQVCVYMCAHLYVCTSAHKAQGR